MENVTLQEKIREFLSVETGSGYGDGYGYGSGDGSGSGYGSGFGSGDGSGFGSGYGSGDGFGYRDGSGDGEGFGSGVEEINGRQVHRIDDVPTVITGVKGNVARGFILQSDLSLSPCYVVKGNGQFAHGEDLHGAMNALADKLFDGMPLEERIAEFMKAHPDKDKAYPNRDLFDWHHRLTGSCLAGRNAFVKDRGLSLEGQTTVADFIQLTKNAYGGAAIRKLAEEYENGGSN